MALTHIIRLATDNENTYQLKVYTTAPIQEAAVAWDLRTWDPIVPVSTAPAPTSGGLPGAQWVTTYGPLHWYGYIRLTDADGVYIYAVRHPSLNAAGSPLVGPRYFRVYKALEARALRNMRYAGQRALVFIRQRYGARCPVCWDAARNVRIRQHCTACYDTGYEVGYAGPLEVYVGIFAGQEQKDLAETSNVPQVTQQYVVRFVPSPYVPETDDLIYFQGDLYRLDRLRVLSTPQIYVDWAVSLVPPDDVRRTLIKKLL